MTERVYRLIVGLTVLTILYFNSKMAMYAVIAIMVFEAVSNWRIPLLVSRLRQKKTAGDNHASPGHPGESRFRFEAERALRLMFAAVLVVTYIVFNEQLWLIPWFAA